MKFRLLLATAALLLPQFASANYDPNKIKQALSDNSKLFLITGWQQNPEKTVWIAQSQQKWLEITVGESVAEIVSPYINPRQISEGQKRCVAFAAAALSMNNDQGKQKLSKLLITSTQHHRLKSLEANGVRLEVTPRLVGAFVKLFCRVMPSQ